MAPPDPPPGWAGVRPEPAFPAACVQEPFQFGAMTAPPPPDPPFATSED